MLQKFTYVVKFFYKFLSYPYSKFLERGVGRTLLSKKVLPAKNKSISNGGFLWIKRHFIPQPKLSA